MASKRKKLKLELVDDVYEANDDDNEAVSTLRSSHHNLQSPHLESLPVELLYKIFDNLPLEHVVKLRQVNKNLQRVIDRAEFIWLRACLSVEISSTLNVGQLNQFMASRPCLDDVRIVCNTILSKEFQRAILPLELEQSVDLRVSLLEVMSMNCLNVFARVCRRLQIDAFAKKISEIRSKRSNEYTTRLSEFLTLETLKIRCLMLSQNDCFIWDRALDNSLFKQMANTFGSVRHLHIGFLNLSRGNLSLFYQSMASLPSLVALQLDHCHFYDSHLTSIEKELNSFITTTIYNTRRLSLEYLTFSSSSVFFIYIVLKYLVNTERVKELGVGARETRSLITNLVAFRLTFILNKYVSDIVSLLSQKCMPNLVSLSTNLFTKYTEASTLAAFSKQLVATTSFVRSISINMSGYNYERRSEECGVKKMLRGMYHSHYASPVVDCKELDYLLNSNNNNNSVENESITSFSLQLNLSCTKKKKITDLVVKILSKIEARCLSLTQCKLRLVCTEHKGVVLEFDSIKRDDNDASSTFSTRVYQVKKKSNECFNFESIRNYFEDVV